ncbi:CLUMA_CG021034, isoform A, partial [Clunio marinus]
SIYILTSFDDEISCSYLVRCNNTYRSPLPFFIQKKKEGTWKSKKERTKETRLKK